MLGLTIFIFLLVQVAARCPEPTALPRTIISGGKEKFMCARLYEKSHPTATLSQCDIENGAKTLDIAHGDKPAELSGWIRNGVQAAVVRPGCTLDIYRFPNFGTKPDEPLKSLLKPFSKRSFTGGAHQFEDGKSRTLKGKIMTVIPAGSITLKMPTSTAFGNWFFEYKGSKYPMNPKGGSYQCYCPVENKALWCKPRDAYVVINDCDNVYGHGTMSCVFSVSSGVTKTSSKSNSKNKETTISAEVIIVFLIFMG